MRRPILRLLVDSCLTPQAVPALAERFGARIESVHLDATAPRGLSDEAVLLLARSERRIVVTANGGDFIRLSRLIPDHAGIVIVNDQDTRDRQIAAMLRAAAMLLARQAEGRPIEGRALLLSRSGRLLDAGRRQSR